MIMQQVEFNPDPDAENFDEIENEILDDADDEMDEDATYSVGRLEHPHEDDQRFHDETNAIRNAMAASIDDSVYGVWDDDTGELLHIVYQRQVFSS